MRIFITAMLIMFASNVSAGDGGSASMPQRYNYKPQVIQLDPVQQYLIQQQAQQRDLEMRQQQYFMQRNAADNYRREYGSPLRIYGY